MTLAPCAVLVAAATAQVAPTWNEVTLSGRRGHAAAYDLARGQLAMCGGRTDMGIAVGAAMWESDGVAWSRRTSATDPGVRSFHAMAYDEARQRMVVFGGLLASIFVLADTWEWDGVDWRALHPANVPSGRFGHAMAYDAARRRVVLYGGNAFVVGSGLTDTWEWDGSNWRLMAAAGGPPASLGTAMAYDAARQRTVLFGGTFGSGSVSAQTWEWDGTVWSQRTPFASPPARTQHAMTYDALRRRVVLFGGSGASGLLADTWEWDGVNWLPTTATGPSARAAHALVYDPGLSRSVLIAGGDAGWAAGAPLGDVWEWDGATWAQRVSTPAPGPRVHHAMAYDERRQRVVMLDETSTFEWDGVAWGAVPVAAPPARTRTAMAYDARRQRTVVFGGTDPNVPSTLGDTWEWDGTAWVQRFPVTSPRPRSEPAMAYDAARQRVVLFGGYGANARLGDTWEWDGVNWTQRTSALAPSPRGGAAMAYDEVHQSIVLYGGDVATGLGDDTWEWDGTNWAQRQPASRPGPRFDYAMTYDRANGRVVLFGGSSGLSVFDETWTWDGVAWSRLASGSTPTARQGAAMVYDSARREILLYGGGGSGFGGRLAETWRLGVHGTVARFGTGCRGGGNAPTLASSAPRLGGGLTLTLSNARPSSVGVLGLAAGTHDVAIGSCHHYLPEPVVRLVVATNGIGYGGTPRLPIPSIPALLGSAIQAQGFVLDPAAPPLGLAFSQGLRIVLGN